MHRSSKLIAIFLSLDTCLWLSFLHWLILLPLPLPLLLLCVKRWKSSCLLSSYSSHAC
uniref:Uncharacterized protein n=1 Tax=Manihot esculenta TaxID=3983 RepID=A0A2C9WG49_MANES